MASATMIAIQKLSGPVYSEAATKPAIEAVAATDRSIPPVSIIIVWQPARIASGIDERIVVAM